MDDVLLVTPLLRHRLNPESGSCFGRIAVREENIRKSAIAAGSGVNIIPTVNKGHLKPVHLSTKTRRLLGVEESCGLVETFTGSTAR